MDLRPSTFCWGSRNELFDGNDMLMWEERGDDPKSKCSFCKNCRKFRKYLHKKIYLRAYSQRALASTLVMTLERNTLVSIASFTPSVSVSVNTGVKIQMDSGMIQKRQRWRSVWTRLYSDFLNEQLQKYHDNYFWQHIGYHSDTEGFGILRQSSGISR